jgi:hypothetical protein
MPGYGVGHPERNYGTPGVGGSPAFRSDSWTLGRTRRRLPVPEKFVRNTRGDIPRRFGSPVTTPLGEPTHSFSRRLSSASLSTFRINTSKSVSKQMTLSPFRINTCEKAGGGGCPPSCIASSSHSNAFSGNRLASVPSVAQWQIQSRSLFPSRFGRAKGIEEFDSYEGKFGLESGCWSTRRGRRSRHRSAGRTGRTLTKR